MTTRRRCRALSRGAHVCFGTAAIRPDQPDLERKFFDMNHSGKRTDERYGSVTISLHWLTLALLVGVYACIQLREFFPRGSPPREALATWHYMLGLTTFGVVFLRIVFRLANRTPPIEPPPPRWQQRLAGLVHLALYAFLVAMPLLGWLTLSTADEAVPLFGLQLPPLAAPDRALSHNLKEIHETIGTAGYYLIGLHAAAALFHHYFLRDNTLRRMLPRPNRG
jgi:cytochrome b561